MKNNSNTETLQICRTCMKEFVNESLFFILDFTPAIKQKLCNCFPELDLSIVPNAVICNECADIVNSIYKFKNECIQTEMKIHKYIQQLQQTDNLADLVEVVQFHRQLYGNLRAELKTETFEVKLENISADDPTLCDGNACNEAVICTNSTEREYLLTLQKVELEDVLFNTDVNLITYNSTSESTEISDTRDGNIAQNNIPQAFGKQDDYIHNVDTSDIMYQCYTCGHKAESKLKLIVHIKSHRVKNQHPEIASKNLLRNNESVQRNRNIENNKVKCGSRIYSKLNSKNQSKRKCQVSDSRNNFDQGTSSKSNVQNHTLKKPFKCLVCEYQCNLKSSLTVHMRIHTGEKPFKCSVCEYQCTTKCSLKVHIRIHADEKPYKCSVCEYHCIAKGTLKTHMRIHTGEKAFKCSVCKCQFRRKYHLKPHMLIHTDEKRYKCSICEYQCTLKYSLQRHMRIHTGEKPFKCSLCGYRCARKNSLKIHIGTNSRR